MVDDGSKSTTRLHEPLIPAYQELSSTNHGAYVMIIAVILVIVSGLAVGIKLQTTLSKFRKLRADDFALLAAMVTFSYRNAPRDLPLPFADFARSSQSDTQSRSVGVCSMASVGQPTPSPRSKRGC